MRSFALAYHRELGAANAEAEGSKAVATPVRRWASNRPLPLKANDSDARLYRKGPGMEARLCFIGHGLMENRSGLIVDARLTRVSGHAERFAALDMVQRWGERRCAVTLGADRGYDAPDFVEELRGMNVRPHVARISAAGARRLISARRGIRATPRASAFVSASRKRSAGSSGWADCARPS